jgi:hypothetical protein
MAATGLSVCVALLAGADLLAAQTGSAREQLGYVAAALTAGNPADAMTPFDKTFGGYEKLRDRFAALTSAFQLASALETADGQVSTDETTLSVNWTLTLTDPRTGYAQNRSATINVRLVLKKGKWKIVEFAPLELFDPQVQQIPKRQ